MMAGAATECLQATEPAGFPISSRRAGLARCRSWQNASASGAEDDSPRFQPWVKSSKKSKFLARKLDAHGAKVVRKLRRFLRHWPPIGEILPQRILARDITCWRYTCIPLKYLTSLSCCVNC